MQPPRLVTTEENRSSHPVLIVDRHGTLGVLLAKRMQHEFLTIFVSSVHDPDLEDETVYIPFRKQIPKIPDNTFSSIFVVYEGGKQTTSILPSLVKKAIACKAPLFLIVYRRDLTEKLYSVLMNETNAVRLVIVGDVFGSSHVFPSDVTDVLAQAKRGQIIVVGEGLHAVYPVHIDDAVVGIIAAAFADTGKERTFFLFPKHGVTELSFARKICQAHPDVRLDFSKKGRRKTDASFSPGRGMYLLADPYPLGERLLALSFDGNTPLQPVIKTREKSMSAQVFKQFFGLVFVLGAFALLPLLFLFGLGIAGGALLSESVQALERGDLVQARRLVSYGGRAFALGGEMVAKLLPASRAVGLAGATSEAMEHMRTGVLASDAAASAIDALSSYERVFAGTSPVPKQDFLDAIQESREAVVVLQQLQAENRLPSVYAKRLVQYERPLAVFLAVADVLPELMGFDGKKTYLVLFQNNMELRPGGGFIGSYGLLSLEQGRVREFSVHDVYDADGQLKGHVEPPFALRRYLGASNWFLRDSNFSVDFPESAREAANFLYLETGQKVDGVIGVDVSYVRDLLIAIGPVSLPDYNQTITGDNFFPVVESEIKDGFFPGSTQKKDILTAVYARLNEKLFASEKMPPYAVLAATVTGIDGKHVLFSFPDPTLQKVFVVNNFAGSVRDDRSADEGSVIDSLLLSEANVGANKANYYVRRSISQDVSIAEDGRVTEAVTVTYQHTGTEKSRFGGDYKNYLRVVLPMNTTLIQVVIDGNPLEPVAAEADPQVYTGRGFRAPQGLEVEATEVEGKRVFGFLVTVPSGERKTVQLTYQLAQTVALSDPTLSYDLRVLKQPGTDNDPYSLTLRYPQDYRPIVLSGGLLERGDVLIYAGSLATDRHFRADFSSR